MLGPWRSEQLAYLRRQKRPYKGPNKRVHPMHSWSSKEVSVTGTGVAGKEIRAITSVGGRSWRASAWSSKWLGGLRVTQLWLTSPCLAPVMDGLEGSRRPAGSDQSTAKCSCFLSGTLGETVLQTMLIPKVQLRPSKTGGRGESKAWDSYSPLLLKLLYSHLVLQENLWRWPVFSIHPCPQSRVWGSC